MATSVRICNISPLGALRVVLPDGDSFEVDAGAVVSVIPEVAGVGPHWRRLAADEPVRPYAEHRSICPGGHEEPCPPDHFEVWDLGEGLLAQHQDWTTDGTDDTKGKGA